MHSIYGSTVNAEGAAQAAKQFLSLCVCVIVWMYAVLFNLYKYQVGDVLELVRNGMERVGEQEANLRLLLIRALRLPRVFFVQWL